MILKVCLCDFFGISSQPNLFCLRLTFHSCDRISGIELPAVAAALLPDPCHFRANRADSAPASQPARLSHFGWEAESQAEEQSKNALSFRPLAHSTLALEGSKLAAAQFHTAWKDGMNERLNECFSQLATFHASTTSLQRHRHHVQLIQSQHSLGSAQQREQASAQRPFRLLSTTAVSPANDEQRISLLPAKRSLPAERYGAATGVSFRYHLQLAPSTASPTSLLRPPSRIAAC